MKIQCDVCEAAAAEVVCCTEEVALCGGCDLINHAPGNKIAGTNHQRLPLSAAARPRCDTCQETLGWFFCLEDRVVLCRQCDISTHKSSRFVSGHHRLLLTNVKVGLEPKESTQSASMITEFSQGMEESIVTRCMGDEANDESWKVFLEHVEDVHAFSTHTTKNNQIS